MIENPSVARARELVLTCGWNSTSFQIVNPGTSRWFSERGDAVVGYVAAAGVRVAAGAPVCGEDRLAKGGLAKAAATEAKWIGRRFGANSSA